MFYLDTANQIFFLITLCFSFCILAFAAIFKNAGVFPRLLGYAFFSPFLMCAFSFLAPSKVEKDSLESVSSIMLLLALFILLAAKPSKKDFNIYLAFLFAIPAAVLIADRNIDFIQKWLSSPVNCLLPEILLLIANLFLLKKGRGVLSLVFWAVLAMAAGNALGAYMANGWLAYMKPVLALTSYTLFFAYFYMVYVKDLLSRVSESEKKLNAVNHSIDIEVKKRVLEIEKVNQNLVNISRVDPLTNTLNKAAILNAVENSILMKPKSEFAILMFDIDHFKKINDTMGHIEGDKCLKTLPTTARKNLREFDVIGRYGGDEFIILLPGTNLNQAVIIAERFRRTVDSSTSPHYTVSVGIATYPADGSSVKELIAAADQGLYNSKDKGRNAVSYKDVF